MSRARGLFALGMDASPTTAHPRRRRAQSSTRASFARYSRSRNAPSGGGMSPMLPARASISRHRQASASHLAAISSNSLLSLQKLQSSLETRSPHSARPSPSTQHRPSVDHPVPLRGPSSPLRGIPSPGRASFTSTRPSRLDPRSQGSTASMRAARNETRKLEVLRRLFEAPSLVRVDVWLRRTRERFPTLVFVFEPPLNSYRKPKSFL